MLSACAGGANIPAVNDLLEPFGAAFGDAVLEGDLVICEDDFGVKSGANIARLPAGAWLHTASMTDKATVGEGVCHPDSNTGCLGNQIISVDLLPDLLIMNALRDPLTVFHSARQMLITGPNTCLMHLDSKTLMLTSSEQH